MGSSQPHFLFFFWISIGCCFVCYHEVCLWVCLFFSISQRGCSRDIHLNARRLSTENVVTFYVSHAYSRTIFTFNLKGLSVVFVDNVCEFPTSLSILETVVVPKTCFVSCSVPIALLTTFSKYVKWMILSEWYRNKMFFHMIAFFRFSLRCFLCDLWGLLLTKTSFLSSLIGVYLAISETLCRAANPSATTFLLSQLDIWRSFINHNVR